MQVNRGTRRHDHPVTGHRLQELWSRGEIVDMRTAMRDGVGRTVAEAVEHFSAMADLDDARQAAKVRRAFAEFQGQQFYADRPNGVETEQATARADAAARSRGDARRRRASDARLHRRMSDLVKGVLVAYGWRSR